MRNIFKAAKDTINFLNPFRFSPGEKVVLVNDPKQEVYIVEHLVKDESGMPKISRGPTRQFSPSMCYCVRSEKWGDICDFRSDSLEAKNIAIHERITALINQEIKNRSRKVIDYKHKIEEEEREITVLQHELTLWEKGRIESDI